METRRSIPHFRQRASFNMIAYLVLLGVKLVGSSFVLREQAAAKFSDQYPHLLLPKSITLPIWTVIYVSIFAFTVYQLWLAFKKGREAELEHFLQRMQGWFLLSCLANACRLFAWYYNQMPLSLFFMLVMLFSLFMIHRNFAIARPGASWEERLFIHFPFGLFLGWGCMLTGVYFTAWVASIGWAGVAPMIWITALMTVGALLCLYMVTVWRDVYFGIAGVWAFYGIVLKWEEKSNSESTIVVFAGTVIIAALAVALLVQLLRKRRQVG